MSEERRRRSIKLFCPSLSKLVQFVAAEDERLDLGSISRVFGLNPSTIKLNGHFISRGLDFLACSVTWKSLFSFFSARGLATGNTGSGPLIVGGKLCKVGAKRACDLADHQNEIHCTNDWGNRKGQHEDTNMVKKTRLTAGYEGEKYYSSSAKCDEKGLKRKQWFKALIPQKNARMDNHSFGLDKAENSLAGALPSMQFPCRASKNTKRVREEMVADYPCKRLGVEK